MYLDFIVEIPEVKGKITFRNKNGVEYVYYEYDREYNRTTQKTNPKRATIGKRIKDDPSTMLPNTNFLKYFPNTKLPEQYSRSERSNCLKLGGFLIVRKVFEELKLSEVLGDSMDPGFRGLFLDAVAFTILGEARPGERYRDYAYCHPLFTQDMQIFTEQELTEALSSTQKESRKAFLAHEHFFMQELSRFGFYQDLIEETNTAKQVLSDCKCTEEAERLVQMTNTLWEEYADSEETTSFIRLMALIGRGRIHERLRAKWLQSGQDEADFSLREIWRELEKLEMVRMTDNRYHQANAVSELQMTAFRAFGLDMNDVDYWAKEIERILAS